MKGYTMSTYETHDEIIQKVRAFYRENYNHPESALPCHHCIFEQEPSTESGYVWITCTSDDVDGCNWGNI
jgi:hypothetical protein